MCSFVLVEFLFSNTVLQISSFSRMLIDEKVRPSIGDDPVPRCSTRGLARVPDHTVPSVTSVKVS